MKLLHFPKTNLNTTTRLFNYLQNIEGYQKLLDQDNLVICNLDSECLHSLYNDKNFYSR